ncbi:MAG TPA: redox-regulated ATPase YchF [Candidatus Dojkabacteria bacterium]|nr:redox-regulated ATPase YchF [Candidatus Dojkabacteria bacterium]
MSVIRSHTLSIGIVGLPNSGKSTLFNSLTKNSVPAENFPFTTIDKNVGVVRIPDRRLDAMEDFFKAQKKVPSAMTFVDIAGLVKGASKGEGLGNQFLSHIRECDVIMYVLRAFKSEQIVHVYNRVSPAEDLELVQSELILKDIETVEKKLGELKKINRVAITDDQQALIPVLEKVMAGFNEGKPACLVNLTDDQRALLRELWLLTDKKMMYVLNIKEGMDEGDREKWVSDLEKVIPEDSKEFIIQADVKLVGELSNMNEQEQNEYIELLGFKPKTIEDIIQTAFKRLSLLTFYTGSEKEVNAWTIGQGATVKEAAGVIHTDLGEKFITADVVNVDEMLKVGGWVKAKEQGLVKNYGKDYLIQDGDYINVYANTK